MKVDGDFSKFFDQTMSDDRLCFLSVLFFFTLGEQGNCGTIFFEKRLHGFLHGGQSNNNVIIDLAKHKSGAPHY